MEKELNSEKLKLFGADWCLKSANIRNYLQSQWIEFNDYNVETDKQAEDYVKSLYEGKLKFPTVTFGFHFIKNPSISELNLFLSEHKLISE